MKTILCLLGLFALTLARPDEKKYTDRYDNVDLEEILSNHRLLDGYVKCILETGKCTADGLELKSHIKEAIENHCDKCTEAQVKGTKRMIGHLINHEEAYWNELTAKYDPDRKYAKEYEEELKAVTKQETV